MGKKVSESEVRSEIIVLPEDTNMFGDLYGGRLVEWMDNIGSITAFKHSRKKVTNLIKYPYLLRMFYEKNCNSHWKHYSV